MTNKERLENIEVVKHSGPGASDVLWLIARVKVLTVALEIIADRTFAIDIDHDDFTPDAYLAQIALSDGEGEK